MQNQLTTYLRAGYPGLAVISSEEARAEAEIAAACATLKRRLHAWSSSEGLVDIQDHRITACPDPLEAFQLLDGLFANDTPRHVVLMRDLQLHLDQSDPMLVRRIKDILRIAKAGGHTVILLGCRLKLPPELEHEITHVDFNLPDSQKLGVVLDGILKSAKIKNVNDALREAALQSALGLTTTEAENAFALSVVETHGIDHRIIAREKARTLKKNGLIEVVQANLRSVIQTAEAIAPCVLWIDEIEKGFSGSKSSGSTDGGTSSRVFGSFLSWMQEKDKPVFVVATANDVSKLPPEFLRKGRFDEMFFVDLPDAAERAQIWDIVIKRHGRKPTDFDTVVLSRACEQFTGAEIEAVFIDALHETYAAGREPLAKDIAEAITHTVPLAQLMDGQIATLRHWAKGRAREAASRSTPSRTGRRMADAN